MEQATLVTVSDRLITNVALLWLVSAYTAVKLSQAYNDGMQRKAVSTLPFCLKTLLHLSHIYRAPTHTSVTS